MSTISPPCTAATKQCQQDYIICTELYNIYIYIQIYIYRSSVCIVYSTIYTHCTCLLFRVIAYIYITYIYNTRNTCCLHVLQKADHAIYNIIHDIYIYVYFILYIYLIYNIYCIWHIHIFILVAMQLLHHKTLIHNSQDITRIIYIYV